MLAALVFATLLAADPASVRVIRYSSGLDFTMGEVTSRRIVHPGLGAKKTTLNLSVSQPGAEFAQHVHDYSDDTILVLKGEVDLKQGATLRRMTAGECAFVPTGQIHGTVTAGTGEAVMISFQNPPDLILYAGKRDSKKSGEAPKGEITPGAVKYVRFAEREGEFTSSTMGSMRAAGSYHTVRPGATLASRAEADGEQVIFVWKGEITVDDGSGPQPAGERDAIFLQGAASVRITSARGAELIRIQAPAAAK